MKQWIVTTTFQQFIEAETEDEARDEALNSYDCGYMDNCEVEECKWKILPGQK